MIICYLQFALVALFCFVLVAQWHRLNQVAAHDEFTRAAIVEQIMQVKPNAAENRQNAVDSLRLMHARQADYLSAHPNEGYACQLYNLGSDPTAPSELSVHMADSHYEIKINQCRGREAQHYDDRRYTVVAVPRSDSNPPGSPLYCVDQTGIIRKYGAGHANDVTAKTSYRGEPCPQDGEPVD